MHGLPLSGRKNISRQWIAANLEGEAGNKARAAKKAYEDALREKFFHF
jgi:hypothetical protein